MAIETNAQQFALKQIVALIQSKDIFPGARIFETDLEKKLNVSRTPIRSALDQMVADGILEKKRNQRGYIFPKLSIADLFKAYVFREQLEVTSVSLACLNWNRQNSKMIDSALKLEDDGNLTKISDTYMDLSKGFHVTVAMSTGNEYLVKALKRVYLRLCMYEFFNNTCLYRFDREIEQHRALNKQMILQHESIVLSIAQKDLKNAVKKTVFHLRNSVALDLNILSYAKWRDYELLFPV